MKVGITGSIACGKSTVTNYLREKGYPVIDADKIGHEILLDSKVKEKIKNQFGDKVFKNGEIDRKALGKIVFSNQFYLQKLNEITHPEIKKVILEKFNEYDNDLIFLDAALLFETGFTTLVDVIVTVFADEKNQLERLLQRDDISPEEAFNKIKSQMSTYEKADYADYVIDNNFSLEETYENIEEVLKLLKG